MNYRDDFREVERQAYWSIPRLFGMLVAALGLLFVVGFIATGGDLLTYKYWAPKRADAERTVFENTQSYVQGKTEYIGELRYQYQDAEPGSPHRTSLRMLILSEASTVDNSKLPTDLQLFIRSIK